MLKQILIAFTILFLSINIVYAGCGSCNVSKLKPISQEGDYVLVEKTNKDDVVEGNVLASCGMCNFGMKNKNKCSLAIKIGESVFDVKGTSIDDHGDSHAEDGFCNSVRVAKVTGKIKKNKFYSSSLVLKINK